MKHTFKTIICGLVLLLVCLASTACAVYPPINVKVVDAETGNPVEGAVVLAQWTTTSFGYSVTSDYKVVEETSNKEGAMTIPGVSKADVNEPNVVVYKKGYVAWSNKHIFPDYEKRTNFRWRNGYVFKLDPFKPEYSYKDHVTFLIFSNSASTPVTNLFNSAWRWEELLPYSK